MTRFVRGALAVLVLVVLGGVAFLLARGVVAPALASSAPRVCPAVAAQRVGTISVPAGPVAGFCQDRLVNAAHIINAARALGIGRHTQAIGVMTAIGESGLVDLPHGDAAGPDSRGLFQQRANGAWGSLADRMTPYTAATHFFVALTSIPGWKTLAPAQAAHAVQANADPGYYGRYWHDATTIVAVLDR